jgi:thiol-disulfide isomerase/thioredoxin
MLPLGTQLPPFVLPDATSPTRATVSSSSLAGRVSVVAILCNHCPYVKHVAKQLAAFGEECRLKGVPIVAVSSNDVDEYPDDSPEKMAEEARRVGYTFPYLYDESQDVARAFRAACTPEFYVFDAQGKLAYRGRMDESTPRSNVPPSGKELRAAVDALLAGKQPSSDQKASIGCSIKWKGAAPEYLR